MRQCQVGAERHAAFLDVRAGNINLKRGNPVFFGIDPGGDVTVFLNAFAPDIDNHYRTGFAQKRHIFRAVQEFLHAGALQPDGVEHPAVDFRHSRGRVAVAGLHRNALHHHRAEASQIEIIFIFKTVAKGSGSGHYRVL